MPLNGCESSRTLVSAFCTSLSRTPTSTLVPRTTGALERPMRASRSLLRTWSRSCSSCSLRTAPVSTSSRRCEPPCRSRPSTTRRCTNCWAHFGQLWTVFSEKKFGTASMHTKSAVSRMPNAFHREMYIMADVPLGDAQKCPCQSPCSALVSLSFLYRSALGVVLDRLALGAHARDHRTHLPHAYAVGNLDLDLLLVDHLGNFAHQPPGRNHGVAAAQVLDQVLVLFHPLLLGPQDQEIHQDDDWDHHHQRRGQETVAERAGLRISGRHEHRQIPWISVGRDRLFRPAGRKPKSARTITSTGSIAMWLEAHVRAVPAPDRVMLAALLPPR